MNKKTLNRAAALSIAAVTAFSSLAVTASADLTLTNDAFQITHTVSGTATLVTWSVTSVTTTYTAVLTGTGTSTAVSFSSSTTGLSTQVTTGSLAYGSLSANKITLGTAPYDGVVANSATSTYFKSAADANSFINTGTKACQYENTHASCADSVGASSTVNGTEALAAWKKSWTNYVSDTINNTRGAADGSYKWTTTGGTQVTGTTALSAPANSTFAVTTYTFNSKTSQVTATQLKAKFGDTVEIDNTTGQISTGSDWTIDVSGTSDSTLTGTTADWFPSETAYRTHSTISYQGANGYWYTNSAAAYQYGGGIVDSKTSNYTAGVLYFNAADGKYYTSKTGSYMYLISDAEEEEEGNVFYNTATGKYYLSKSAAVAANSKGTIKSYTRTTGSYFNTSNGYFYSTAYAASLASSYADVTYANGTAYSDYTDPYYYYYLYGYYYGYGSSSSTSIDDGTSPSIYGSSKKVGWTKILNSISKASSGTTVKINMNDATIVPSTIISTAKSKGVNLQFVNSNGSTVKVNSSNITTASTLNTSVTYNTSNIKSSLVTKAKKVNSGTVSTAQITVGSGSGSLGLTEAVTVKLPAKRSGCTVKAYRLVGSKLVCEATSKVTSTGATTLNLKNSGSYLLVVID